MFYPLITRLLKYSIITVLISLNYLEFKRMEALNCINGTRNKFYSEWKNVAGNGAKRTLHCIHCHETSDKSYKRPHSDLTHPESS